MSALGAVIKSGAQAIQSAVEGDVVGAATHAADAILAAVPEEEARRLLSEAAIRRANAIADIAEAAKFNALPAAEEIFDDGTDD